MAVTKVSFEMEVEDTFQNGTKLDVDSLYRMITQVAEAEYNRQFDANTLVKRFGMSMGGNGFPVASDATLPVENDLDEEAVVQTTEDTPSCGENRSSESSEAVAMRSKRRTLLPEKIEAKLFLPR